MRIWTVHTDPAVPPAGTVSSTGRRPPVLVPERFSLAAFLFGVLWLLRHRLWLPALAWLLVSTALALALPPEIGFPAWLALHFLLGAHAQDLRRWALARRGYALAGVVAGPDEEAALARLVDRAPALGAPLMRAALT